MQLFPTLRLGLLNGWLLAAILYLLFGVLLVLFPRPVVARLYDRSGQPERGLAQRLLGVLLFLTWLLLSVLSPLRTGTVPFAVGLTIYGLALAGFVGALVSYAKTPLDQPVTSGLYRVSRHPQQFMISMAFLGISIAMGSWSAVLLICVGVVGAHFANILPEEKACLEQYGDSYRSYMKRVPRYFLFS
jgi:protein-S-isoprenylcysteine O-methyltransferase Ste14